MPVADPGGAHRPAETWGTKHHEDEAQWCEESLLPDVFPKRRSHISVCGDRGQSQWQRSSFDMSLCKLLMSVSCETMDHSLGARVRGCIPPRGAQKAQIFQNANLLHPLTFCGWDGAATCFCWRIGPGIRTRWLRCRERGKRWTQ